MPRKMYNHITECERRIMVITRASQARDGGSIPLARFFKSLICSDLYTRPFSQRAFFVPDTWFGRRRRSALIG